MAEKNLTYPLLSSHGIRNRGGGVQKVERPRPQTPSRTGNSQLLLLVRKGPCPPPPLGLYTQNILSIALNTLQMQIKWRGDVS